MSTTIISHTYTQTELDLLSTGRVTTPVGTHIAGKIFVAELSIKTHSQATDGSPIFFNLLGYHGEISIEESVFSSSIHGSIKVNDTSGFIERYRICGGENMTIILVNQNKEPIIARSDLIVHSIVEGPVDTITLATSYTFYFTSRIFIKSTKTRLYKSFKNQNVLNIVHQIYNDLGESTKLNVYGTEFPTITKPFISTGYTPFKAIEYFAKRLCSTGKFYMFFERVIGTTSSIKKLIKTGTGTERAETESGLHSHHLISIEDLRSISNEKSLYTIVYNPTIQGNIENIAENPDILRTSKVEKITSFNHLEAMLTGFYNSKITSVDPITKTYSTVDIKYNNLGSTDFYTSPLLAENSIFEKFDDNEFPGEKIVFGTSNKNYNAEDIQKITWLPKHVVGQVSKNIFKLKVTIEGSTNKISAGNIVEFKIPSHEAKTTLQEKDNQIYSGKYFVTDVKHIIVGNDYLKEVTLARGSSTIDLLNGTSSRPSTLTPTPSTINDYVVPNLNTEKILGEIIRDYMDVNVVNNVATYSNGGITLKRNLSDGLPIQDSLLVISALNLKINDAKLYTDISYKILAAYIKNGTFKTYGEVFLFFYPGNIRDTSIFGETRIVLGTSGLYLKQSIIDKIKYYI